MRALVLVDLQNDFVPGGALAVPGGDEVVPIANRLSRQFDVVVASQDWHPHDHESFAERHPGRAIGDVIDLHGLDQILWPVHCVQDTFGARFVESLDTSRVTRVFQKGTDAAIDSYSAFFDNGHRKSTGLGDWLGERGVSQVFVLGLALDYCVKFTALDAAKLGFDTVLVRDACRAVNLKAGDDDAAVKQMRAVGVSVVDSGMIDANG